MIGSGCPLRSFTGSMLVNALKPGRHLPAMRARRAPAELSRSALSGGAGSVGDVDAVEGPVPSEDLAVGGGELPALAEGAGHDQPVGEVARRALLP